MLTPYECGRRCRVAFAEHHKLQYGSYRLRNSTIMFRDISVYSVYSDFHLKPSIWWYGIPKTQWDDWNNQFLVLLMKDGIEVNYALLNPNEAIELLHKCRPVTREEKKINIRRPTTAGKIYFVEWDQFPLASRVLPLKVSFDPF